MADFPEARFTITNVETGRSVRVFLGVMKDAGDDEEGAEYLPSGPDAPTVGMGVDDGSIEYQWYYDTALDPIDGVPVGRIVSEAVQRKQDMGEMCVWIVSEGSREDIAAELRVERAGQRELDRLSRLPAPPQWNAGNEQWADLYQWSGWSWNEGYVESAGADTTLGEGIRRDLMFTAGSRWDGDTTGLIEALAAYHLVADTDAKENPPLPDQAAEDETTFTVVSPMILHSNVFKRLESMSCRWVTDGTRIWAADDRSGMEVDDTYWTDMDGTLTGCTKGSPGQAWRIDCV
ncbi:hypothetical protein ACIRRA_22245 [Nocardia sp. NPDC101769]|uniref:hypothetical protein n=1 Tax=Nocardia sp. NPDC101769 TaxID=3364333 RepID=UPI0037F70728